MNLNKLRGWWRLWLASIPVWWAFCLWQHNSRLDTNCAPFAGSGLFENCFKSSLIEWSFAGVFGPVGLLVAIVLVNWVRRGFTKVGP